MTTFPTVLNNVETSLAAAYVSGASLVLAAGYGAVIAAKLTAEGRPPLSPTNWARATVDDETAQAVFKATGLSGDTLTVAQVLEGAVPASTGFAAGSAVGFRDTSGAIRDREAAVNALETAVVHNTGAETVAGSKTFTTPPVLGSLTGLLKASSGALSAAAAGTDYLAPGGSGSGLTGLTESQISGLASDLSTLAGGVAANAAAVALKAPLASPAFTGAVNVPTPSTGDNSTLAASTAFVKAQGYGTVTSVGLSMPGIFTVTSSPVTGAGTLTATVNAQTANVVWAGPTTGAAATPTFRALVAADVPALDAAKVATGVFAAARLPALVGSGSGHAAGIAPDPGATAGIARALREDGSWVAVGNRSARFAAIGDSITDPTRSGGSWFDYACLLSNQKMLRVVNAGVSGDNAAGVLARLQTDVIAYNPGWCAVLIGANDQTISLTTWKTTMASIYTTLLAAGVMPVACTLTPRWDTAILQNQSQCEIIRYLAKKYSLPLVDFQKITINPATYGTAGNTWLSGYSSDGTHPLQPAVRAMATEFVAQVSPYLMPYPPPVANSNIDPLNLFSNGLFLNDSNSDGDPDSWGPGGGSSGITRTLINDPLGHGKLWQFVCASAGTGSFYGGLITTGVNYGDKFAFSFRYQTAGVEAGPLSLQLDVQFPLTGQVLTPFTAWGTDVSDGVYYVEFSHPASGGANPMIRIYHSMTGTGTLRLGQMTLRNLTTGGVAS